MPLPTITEPAVSHDTMWGIQKPSAAPGIKMVTVPVPTVGPKDVRIRVTAFAICGTDLHIVEWDPWAQSRIKPPRHSWPQGPSGRNHHRPASDAKPTPGHRGTSVRSAGYVTQDMSAFPGVGHG